MIRLFVQRSKSDENENDNISIVLVKMNPVISEEDLKNVTSILNATTMCEVLGLDPQLINQPQKLKSAYRRACIKVHPDKNKHPKTVEAFQLVTRCFETLQLTGLDQNVNDKIPKKINTNATTKPKSNQSTPKSKTSHPQTSQPSTKPNTPPPYSRFFGSDFFDDYEEMLNKRSRTGIPTPTQEKFEDILKKMQQQRANRTRPNCDATTKTDTKCQNSANEGSKYCYRHQDYTPVTPNVKPEAPKIKCIALTQLNVQCSKFATHGSPYCTIHLNYDPKTAKKVEVPKKVKCKGITKVGNPCNNYAQKDREFCVKH